MRDDVADAAVSQLNDLVRECQILQDQFDQWDDGHTISGPSGGPREVSLDDLCREWDEANRKLVEHVLSQSYHLLWRLRNGRG